MDFGMISYEALQEGSFHLPAPPTGVLSGRKNQWPRVRVGLPTWGKKQWVGNLFPAGTRQEAFLGEYVRHFDAVELNATHYKIYDEGSITRWADKAGEHDFMFCPKFPAAISHYSGFERTEALTDAFLRGISAFGDRLGPLLLQLSERYSPLQQEKLFNYLASLPRDLPVFLELRHPHWFDGSPAARQLPARLQTLLKGLVITDTPGRRDLVHMQLTLPRAYVRFVCQGDEPLDRFRISQWQQTLSRWFDQGLEDCHFFLHIHQEKSVPDFARYVQEVFAPWSPPPSK